MDTLLTKGLMTLISWFQSLAPEVWKITMKQVMFEGYTRLAWAAFLLLVSSIPGSFAFRTLRDCRKDDYFDDDDTPKIVFLSLLSAGIFAGALAVALDGVNFLTNPGYRAILILFSLVR